MQRAQPHSHLKMSDHLQELLPAIRKMSQEKHVNRPSLLTLHLRMKSLKEKIKVQNWDKVTVRPGLAGTVPIFNGVSREN